MENSVRSLSCVAAEYNPDAPSMEPRMWGRQYFNRPAGQEIILNFC